MNTKTLSNEVLHEQTLLAAKNEKQATFKLLEFLVEVDERRIYSQRGYSSLWEYVHKALRYSESQASERVSTMRLMVKVPEVREKIETEELTLTSALKLAAFVKREECSVEKTVSILEEIAGKSTRQAERILACEQIEPIVRPDFLRPSGPETTRIAFDADSEFMSLFEELKNLQGTSEVSMCERLKAAMKTEVLRKRSFRPRPRTKNREEKKEATNAGKNPSPDKEGPVLRAPEVKGRSFSVLDKRYVAIRSKGQCEFIDPQTERRCECRFGLQFDHIYPYAMGGGSNRDNVRHLCPEHNRLAAIRAFGREKIRARSKTP